MSGKYLFLYLVIILASGVVIGFCLGFFFSRNKRNVEADLRDKGSLFSNEIKHYDCVQCCKDAGDIQRVMILCPKCGNKRCPKALNHRNRCTRSNDVGQIPELEQHNAIKRLDGGSLISNSK
jgi:uncharacterized protein YneF (UPF0154 family)